MQEVSNRWIGDVCRDRVAYISSTGHNGENFNDMGAQERRQKGKESIWLLMTTAWEREKGLAEEDKWMVKVNLTYLEESPGECKILYCWKEGRGPCSSIVNGGRRTTPDPGAIPMKEQETGEFLAFRLDLGGTVTEKMKYLHLYLHCLEPFYKNNEADTTIRKGV